MLYKNTLGVKSEAKSEASITSIFCMRLKGVIQGQIQDFFREGASQAKMTDVQSQKSAEELPNMHASTNWVSWQGTTGLLTTLIEI